MSMKVFMLFYCREDNGDCDGGEGASYFTTEVVWLLVVRVVAE